MPARVQLTVQPNEWRRTDRFSLHRSILQPDEIRHYEGVTVTTAARAVVDAASEGADPEQIQKAVTQGLERGLLAAGELDAALDRRRFRNKRSVSRLIKDAANS